MRRRKRVERGRKKTSHDGERKVQQDGTEASRAEMETGEKRDEAAEAKAQ